MAERLARPVSALDNRLPIVQVPPDRPTSAPFPSIPPAFSPPAEPFTRDCFHLTALEVSELQSSPQIYPPSLITLDARATSSAVYKPSTFLQPPTSFPSTLTTITMCFGSFKPLSPVKTWLVSPPPVPLLTMASAGGIGIGFGSPMQLRTAGSGLTPPIPRAGPQITGLPVRPSEVCIPF